MRRSFRVGETTSVTGRLKRSSTSERASALVKPPTRTPPIVTPGWISFVFGGVVDGKIVVGSSIGGGIVGVVGIVSSAPAVAANATKSTTEQGRIASVARRRMRGECSGTVYGVREVNDLTRRCADRW